MNCGREMYRYTTQYDEQHQFNDSRKIGIKFMIITKVNSDEDDKG